jgi:hypothetical protein
MADAMQGWRPAPGVLCGRCHAQPVGPGGIICPDSRDDIEAMNRTELEEGNGR